MKQKLPTSTKIEVKVNVDKPITATVEYKDNTLRILDEYGNCIPFDSAKVMKSRPRASSDVKGDKTLSECMVNTASLSVNRTVNDNFDVVYAIDTNTKEVDGLWYSVGVLLKLIKFEEEVKDNFPYELKPIQFITSNNNCRKTNMEQWVWLKVIELICEYESADKKIGLVVDCDLGNLDKYNNKEKKICDKEFLPENITLLYASADNKNSNILNIMIAAADKFATEYLKSFVKIKVKRI